MTTHENILFFSIIFFIILLFFVLSYVFELFIFKREYTKDTELSAAASDVSVTYSYSPYSYLYNNSEANETQFIQKGIIPETSNKLIPNNYFIYF